jgi:hypothetical protein
VAARETLAAVQATVTAARTAKAKPKPRKPTRRRG